MNTNTQSKKQKKDKRSSLEKLFDEVAYEYFYGPKEPFNPVSDEYQEVCWEKTPIGGDVTITVFYDKNGNRCKKSEMAYCDTTIYEKDGTYVNCVLGARPLP